MFLYIVSYITYASPLESKVWLDAVMIFQINNMQKGGFLCDNEIILIHQTTNFYAPKTFLCILTTDSMHLIVITCHDSNFKFIIFSEIFKVDLESCVKISGVQWSKPF